MHKKRAISQKNPKNQIIKILWRAIVVLVMISAVFALALFFSSPGWRGKPEACFKDACVEIIEIADTQETRHAGLTIYDHLNPDTGMLFVFPKEQTTGFWMKGMTFPIDLIRINEKMRVVDLESNMEPCREEPCKIYNSYFLSKYAVEVPAGFVQENNIQLGDKVEFRNLKYGR